MTSATIPTARVVQWMSSSVRSQLPSSRQLFVPLALVPVSLGSSPITTSIAAPKRNPVITGFDSSRDSQPIRRTAASRKSNPVATVIAATSCAVGAPLAMPVIATALAAIAASAELGPVEICREVPKAA